MHNSPTLRSTPEKEAYWKKWIALYNNNMLSQGDFRNLYTFGYDMPEAYAIEKDGKDVLWRFTIHQSRLPSTDQRIPKEYGKEKWNYAAFGPCATR